MKPLPRFFALVPAAGKSTRMGRPKLALPLGDRTILERVIDALRAARVDEVLVVLGPHVAELDALARAAGAKVLLLDHDTPDMRTTVERGLTWLEREVDPRQSDLFLLAPADHPTLASQVVAHLLDAASGQSPASIFIPTYAGRRGHPALIGWRHVSAIRSLPEDQGINTYVRQHDGDIHEVPVGTAEILHDLDTPQDYERLRTEYPA